MSSLTYETGKRTGYRLRVYTAAGRRSIWLGRIGESDATAIHRHVDEIIAAQTADLPIPRATQRWLDQFPNRELVAKLVPVLGTAKMLSSVVDLFLDEKSRSVTASTLASIQNSLQPLTDAFGSQQVQSVDSVALRSIHDGLCVGFSTRGKFAAHWRQFFAWCVKNRYAVDNPAAELSTATMVGGKHYVAAETIETIIAATDDPHLRAAIALARWGGIRMPSELYPISADSIDTSRQRLRIQDPKRDMVREIPIFPELVPHIEAIRTMYVSGLTTLSPSGITDRVKKLLTLVNIKPWPRLWHSMRATRETELIKAYGINAACLWLGNSERVALKHYSLVDDATWDVATKPSKTPAP
jgi:integrase